MGYPGLNYSIHLDHMERQKESPEVWFQKYLGGNNMPRKVQSKRIYREGRMYFVGRPNEIFRTRTGAGKKGFLNAIKYVRGK